MRLGTAIECLVDNYKYASDKEWINDKVAWALYHTWKEADRKTENSSEKPNNSTKATISKMEQVDEPTEITYQNCSDALLKMWMDNVLTDAEYNRIMDKLNNAQRKDEPQTERSE